MSEASTSNPGQRFAQDLHRIREDRGVTLEELHEETKIPIGLLEQFEATGLLDHPMFNRVYLRSLVRTYARKVDLPIDQTLEKLELALSGEYAGELAAEYFDEPLDRPARSASEEPDGDDEETTTAEEETAPGEEETTPAAPAGSGREAASGAPTAAPPASEGTRMASPRAQPAEEEPTPRGEPKPPPRSAPVSRKKSSRRWMLWGAVLVGVLLVGVLVVTFTGGEGGETPSGDTAASPDTAATEDTTTVDMPPLSRADVSVGDTMNVLVVAQEAPVQGIRITRDQDVRRPYWIEQGQATAFPVRRRIVIEQELDKIGLFLEGYSYPTSRRDEQGRIVITRSDAEAFVDTLAGAPSAPGVPTEVVTPPSGSSF